MTIRIGTELYGVQNSRTVVAGLAAAIKAADADAEESVVKSAVKKVGTVLARLLKDPVEHPFADFGALYAHLDGRASAGVAAQARGEQFENLCAAHISGSVARAGATPPTWAATYASIHHNADPDLRSKDGKITVKPDVWSDTALGICGGGAKSHNLDHFGAACRNLEQVCTSHQVTPMVFCQSNTPSSVLQRALASGITATNVLVLDDSTGQWKDAGAVLQSSTT